MSVFVLVNPRIRLLDAAGMPRLTIYAEVSKEGEYYEASHPLDAAPSHGDPIDGHLPGLFHPGVDPVAAQETARTGVVPNYYLPFHQWTQALFVIYSILAFSALAAYGGAVLSTRVLPHWVGWLAIVSGLAGLGLVGITGDADPF